MASVSAPSSFRSNTPIHDYKSFGHVNNANLLVARQAGHIIVLHNIMVSPVGTVAGDYSVRSGTSSAATNVRLLDKLGAILGLGFSASSGSDEGIAMSVVSQDLYGHFDDTETMRVTFTYSYVKADDE